jgi:hypothetical protein
MIGIIFEFVNERVEVRIQHSTCYFRTSPLHPFVSIEGIRLDKKGVIKEFPDLKDKDDWRQQAIERFKEKMKGIETEKGQAEYIMEELVKYGYKPLYLQKEGFRPIKLNV